MTARGQRECQLEEEALAAAGFQQLGADLPPLVDELGPLRRPPAPFAVEVDGVLDDEGRRPGLVAGDALDAAAPDLAPCVGRPRPGARRPRGRPQGIPSSPGHTPKPRLA